MYGRETHTILSNTEKQHMVCSSSWWAEHSLKTFRGDNVVLSLLACSSFSGSG